MKLTFNEYFAGIGLVRMGLKPHGWEVQLANDFAPKKYEMYCGFFPDAPEHYIVNDVFTIDPAVVPDAFLSTCSFPCIDLSLAGNMGGMGGKHSSAFWGFTRILEGQGDKRSPLVLVENVPGWLYSNQGADFRVTIQALNRLGYACDVFVLDALRFTPQSRPRVFVLGCSFIPSERGPEGILARSKGLAPDALKRSVSANRELGWLHIDLPEPPPKNTAGLESIIEPLEEDDPRWWPTRDVDRHLAMMDKLHRSRVARLAKSDKYAHRTFYRRRRKGLQRAEVRDDEIAGCLRTAVGGSGKQFLIRAGLGSIRMRTMTPREYANLQGVPDGFKIAANGVQALTGFGDAVCVPVISWIAEHALSGLVEIHRSGEQRRARQSEP